MYHNITVWFLHVTGLNFETTDFNISNTFEFHGDKLNQNDLRNVSHKM